METAGRRLGEALAFIRGILCSGLQGHLPEDRVGTESLRKSLRECTASDGAISEYLDAARAFVYPRTYAEGLELVVTVM